jgi:purine-binding chemotaxis protein CheW
MERVLMASLHEAEPMAGTPVQSISEGATTNQFVTFTCGQRAFGIEIMSVREIRSWSPTTPLPGQPFGAQGVLDIRGKIVEVYDLLALLGEGGFGGDSQTGRIVLVVSLGQDEVGIVADAVSDIIFAGRDDMRPAPSGGQRRGEPAVSGLVKNEDRLIAILNLAALFPGYDVQ